MMAKEIYKFT